MVLLHGNTRYVILVDVIQTLLCFDDQSSVSVRQKSAKPMECVNAGRQRTVRTQGNEDTIVAAVEREPWRSSRDIARELRLSEPSVLEVQHDDQLRPDHYSRSAHSFPADRPLRMQFWKQLWHRHAADKLLLHNIWWTDEACFTRNSMFSVHNSHLWARDNPHAICKHGHYQMRFSISYQELLSSVKLCYLTVWLTNDIVIFLKLFYRGCLKLCL
jgi:hypothetical protein